MGGSIIHHWFNLNFNSILFRIIGDFDLDDWADLCKSTDPPSLRIIMVTVQCVLSALLQFFLQIHHQHRRLFWSIVQEITSLMKPALSQVLSQCYFFRKMFEFLVVITQPICRCRNVSPKRCHKVFTSSGANEQSSCSFTSAFDFSMLEDACAGICWAISSHQSATAP